ncbi:MAG TPA: argininosuccinate lyase [archaeon]|nr:argininosuccinate lyase [archaeon]HLD80602.1 argininosuccinate lyase [archaeon]
MKLWEKNYKLDEKVEAFTVGNDYLLDQRLVKYDCAASIAHVKMLYRIGFLDEAECAQLVGALEELIALDQAGKFSVKKSDEDCHTAIEAFLTQKLGDAGKKVHAARSRNDQVLAALRLYYKDELVEVSRLVDALALSLESFGKKYGKVKVPGYTHTRKAMPSSFGLWSQAFVESMADNKKLLAVASDLIDQSPLGTGAGYGLPVKVDRELTAKLLDFKKVQENPLYVQNSRGKFEATILHCLSQIMLDLNKLASDLMLFSTKEFGFIELPPEICTGSSIMPQKKNPDVLELLRAKYHKVLALEQLVKTVSSNLISGYNRDVQLTKEPVMASFDEAKNCLEITYLVLSKIKIDNSACEKAMTEDLNAAGKALELAAKGVPFRTAYQSVSNGL